MSDLLTAKPNKPNRLDKAKYPNKDNNADYHLDYAKWAVSAGSTAEHTAWLAKLRLNKMFYKGDQWKFKEDVDAFLKDSSGQERNRIKIVHNLIRPMVEQYRGNAIRLGINATAKSVSKLAINRRESKLEERLFKTDVANEFPAIGAIQKKNDKSIGRDRNETTEIFNNLYVDDYVKQMNKLLRYSASLNRFKAKQTKMAQDLGLSGLIVEEGFEHGGHLRFGTIEPEDFGWDRNARLYDLSDADFMWASTPMDPSAIFETWQEISHDDRVAIERHVSNDASNQNVSDSTTHRTWAGSRIPVCRTFWRDIDQIKHGWVEDENGYPYLARIDYLEPGETEPKWTEADLIDPPDTPKNRRLFKGKKTRNLVLDVLRYCVFISGETVGRSKESGDMENSRDIALEWGVYDYQETDYLDLSNVKFPFKCHCWGYVDGEVFSPVDDAINPQRFINRVLSATESQINNSGGSNVIIDEDTINPQDRDQIYSDIDQSRPITIRTKGRGVPNSVGVYDATPKQGTYKMFEIIPLMKQLIQDTTGVNEALKGESIGTDQLVGVTNSLIQRGSLMQEPFYDAITQVFVQMYQHIATVGKKMYINNERELAIAVGDDGVDTLVLSAEMLPEDFRVFIERDTDESLMKQQANGMLNAFLQLQFIDKTIFANLYDRATPNEVMMAVREHAGLQLEADRRSVQAQEQEAEDIQQATADERQQQEQAINVERGIAQAKDVNDKQHDLDKIFAKGLVDMSKEKGKQQVA